MGTYSQEERDKMPASAFCGPNRTFPILDQEDVHKAVSRLNTTEHDVDPIKSCVIGKAKAHGWDYPDAWKTADHSGTCPTGIGAAFDGAETARREGEYVVRRGKIFEAGDFPDKDFRADPEDLWAATLGFSPVPLDLEHTPTVLQGKLGTLDKIELSANGTELYGEARLPAWLDALIPDSERKVSCTWDRATKRLTGLSLVRTPRISDAALMAAFAGARHSAADTADMQQIHDIAARQGAACKESNVDDAAEGDPMATNDQDLNAQIGLFGKFMRWMGNEQPQTASATNAAFSAPPAPLTTAAPQPDPEKDALRAQLAQLRAQQIADRAAAFAAEQIGANKALPAQRDALIVAYSVAAADDAEHGQATFGNAKTGRVDALAALFTNAPTHALTQQLVPVVNGTVTAGNLMQTAGVEGDRPRPMSPERMAELLGKTPQGQSVLRDIVAKK